MKFFHVSMDLKLGEKEFIPRIPAYRCKNENDTIKRVCVCSSLEGAIGAFPYKHTLVKNVMDNGNEGYLTVYEVPSEEVKHLTDSEIKDFVPDSHLTKEHWVLNSFKSKAELIKIKTIELSNYNMYTNEYTGFVENISYEKSVESFERECEYTFVWKKYLKDAINYANTYGIKYEIIEEVYNHLHYINYVIENTNYTGTTKRYKLTKIRFYIPKNKDVSELWLINHNQQEYSLKKNIMLKPFLATKKDLEDIQNCYEEGLLH